MRRLIGPEPFDAMSQNQKQYHSSGIEIEFHARSLARSSETLSFAGSFEPADGFRTGIPLFAG